MQPSKVLLRKNAPSFAVRGIFRDCYDLSYAFPEGINRILHGCGVSVIAF
jgi:hypothetical protein